MMTIDKTKLKSEVESILAKGAGLLMAIRAEDVRGLLEEIERLEKRVAELSPLKNLPAMDWQASNKCLACGEYHYGLSGLPCPKMTPVAQAFSLVNQRVVPVEPNFLLHPLEDIFKGGSHG